MEAKAQARFVRVTPQKARRVVDLIRGKQAQEAVATLSFAPQAAGEVFDAASLMVAEAYVDEGPTLKRFRPRAQGRAARILKRTSHITVVVAPAPEKAGAARATATTTKGRTR